jgi:hypothetical protein
VQLDFHGRRFEWTFFLVDVSFTIIGVDFLRRLKLLVDPASNRLVDRVVDPYSFFPDPDPEFEAGDQSGSGSGSNTDLGL